MLLATNALLEGMNESTLPWRRVADKAAVSLCDNELTISDGEVICDPEPTSRTIIRQDISHRQHAISRVGKCQRNVKISVFWTL